MAYMSQENKKKIVAGMKPILAKYGVKATFGVRNHSTIVVNIKSGAVDFFADMVKGTSYLVRDYTNVNPYHYQYQYTGKTLSFLKEAFAVLNGGNHDNSDIQSDYFDVGWYIDMNIGEWDKPYVLVK